LPKLAAKTILFDKQPDILHDRESAFVSDIYVTVDISFCFFYVNQNFPDVNGTLSKNNSTALQS